MKKTTLIEIVSVLVIVVTFFLFGKVINSEYKVASKNVYVDITENAELFYNDKLVCMGNVSKYDISGVKYADEFKIVAKLDKKNIKKPIITFNNKMNLAYKVKLNGKVIESYKMNSLKNSVVCSEQIRIPLKAEEVKGQIEITFRCTNGKAFTKIPNIICIKCSEDAPNFVMSNIEYIVIGFVLIEMGLLFIIFMWINSILKIVNKKLVYIGCACIATGMWIFSCYQIFGLVTNNIKFDFYLEYTTLTLTVIFISLYVRELYEDVKDRKILCLNAILALVVIIISIVLQINNIVFMNDSVVAIQMCFLTPIVYIFKKHTISLKENNSCSVVKLIEIGIMIVILGYYMASHFTSREMDALNLVIVGLIIFYLQAIKEIVREIQDSYLISAEEKSIARLAYMDTLTGLSNRRALEKYIDNINNKEKVLVYTVCSFDLNRLKKINDTYGHAAGDTLIKSFASELKSSIAYKEDFVGRMGGDEFIAIIQKERAEDILNNIKENISKKNKNGEFEYKVKYSVGTSDYISDGTQDIQDSIRMADYAMYEMKSSYGK